MLTKWRELLGWLKKYLKNRFKKPYLHIIMLNKHAMLN